MMAHRLTLPLLAVLTVFAAGCSEGEAPITDGRAGLEVVRILEAAQESMRKDGARVSLEPPR